MPVLLSLVACLVADPLVCETVIPERPPATLSECLGVGSQFLALQWFSAHPEYLVGPIRCTTGGTLEQMRARVEMPAA